MTTTPTPPPAATGRRLRWLAGVAAPLLALEVGLRMIAPSLPSPEPWPSVGHEVKADYAERIVAADEPTDVVFLGSSITEAGIDPDHLLDVSGVRSFNGGGPYSTPIGMEAWLERGLWELDPDLLVVGLSIWGAEGDAESDVLGTGFARLDTYADDRDSPLAASELWTRRAQLRDVIDLLDESVTAGSYTERGHLTRYHDDVRRTAEDLSTGRAFPGFADDHVAALDRIIAEADRRGIDVVFLLEPGGCPAVLVGCANEQSEAEARTAVADLAARLGVGWIDARSFDAPDEWFADSAHFNRTGTLRYTEFIAASLADR